MKPLMLKPARTLLMAIAMSATGFIATAPLQSVMAQARVLPDFTDLVDLVGPSVVNIRTMEKVSQRTAHGGLGGLASGPAKAAMDFHAGFVGQGGRAGDHGRTQREKNQTHMQTPIIFQSITWTS